MSLKGFGYIFHFAANRSDDYFLPKRTWTLCNDYEIRERNENEQKGKAFKFGYEACDMTAVTEASIMILWLGDFRKILR